MPSSASPAIPLYVASGLGEVQKTMTLFATVTGAVPEPAAPFDFINAANNTAAFYIAKHFTGCSRNFTICDGVFSFESALRLALLECRRAAANYVLVGGIDEAIASRAEYGRRYAGADPHTMAEGSYWFLLSAQAAGAIAEVLLAEIFANRPGDDADAWALDIARVLREHAPAHSPLQLLSGAGVDTQHTKALMQHFSGSLTSKNNSIKSYSYPTAAARDLSRWLRHTSAGEPAIRCAAHVSRDSLGRTAVTLLRKSPR